VVAGKHPQRLFQTSFGLINFPNRQVQVGHLGKNPGTVLGFPGRCRLVSHLHQLQGTFDVAEEFAQIRSARQPRNTAGFQVEHPLGGRLRVFVVAQFGIGVGQKSVNHHVVRHSLV